MQKDNSSEAKIQAECVIWFWNTHHPLRGLFFAVTNNSENIGRAMQRKATGLCAGVSDCIFIFRGSVFCFEFKTETGRQSQSQIEWMKKVNGQGVNYYLIRNFEQFKTQINELICN
jgi:penicillin-binding protein-related factor A (putative recombinase)